MCVRDVGLGRLRAELVIELDADESANQGSDTTDNTESGEDDYFGGYVEAATDKEREHRDKTLGDRNEQQPIYLSVEVLLEIEPDPTEDKANDQRRYRVKQHCLGHKVPRLFNHFFTEIAKSRFSGTR